MAQIDAYNYSLLGFVECPSRHDFVHGSVTRKIAVYRIEEDAEEYDAKKGDILIGGGKAEAQTLRIAMPEMFYWMNDKLEDIERPETIIYPLWSPTFSFMIGEGFSTIGWNPKEMELEVWLAEKVMNEFILHPTKSSPFEAFKNYLSIYFPTSNITEYFSLGANYHVRFELGDELPNGSDKRIEQATNRACELFRDFFGNIASELWLFAYEDLNPYFDKTLNFYLPSLLRSSSIECYEEIELACHSGSFDDDENGNSIPRQYDAKLIVAKVKIENLPIEAIFRGIASFEMGKIPCFPQEIYLYEDQTSNAFRMYDDRGCYVWSDDSAKIQSFFERHKNWVPEYHLEEIMEQFLDD